jgi:outer membrane protein OmpA-like peptidoglycan-associated protein
MSLPRDAKRSRVVLALLAIALLASFLPLTSFAQDTNPPKAEIFGGYSWYNPGGTVLGTKVPSIPKGWGGAFTYDVNKWLGFTADVNGHYKREVNVYSFTFGPQFKIRSSDHFQPFIELLVGFSHIDPSGLQTRNEPTAIGGGGFDIYLNRHFSWRLLQADYVYTTYRDKALMLNSERLDGARIQTGVVFAFGGAKPLPPAAASCSAATPAEVLAGEPVHVTITPSNFNPKRKLTYAWTSTGGKASGTDTTAAVDTTGLAPGSYTVTGKVDDDKQGKNHASASCTSSFTVKEPPKHPPTISCAANPTTVKSGDPATITASTTNPDTRQLTTSWNASAGRITGTGNSVQLDTAGAPAGPITVNCTVSDDRGLTASGTTSVNVEVPPPPPTASKLNEINFPDTKKPWRVDNAAKAILDDVALKLQREADAKAVVIGSADPDEMKVKKNANLAAQRAFNTKEYLTTEKGIDPSRIELRTGGTGTKAEIWVVPAGASFTGEGTTVVDESKMVKPPAAKPAKKAAPKKAAPAKP